MSVFFLQKSYLPSKKFQVINADTGKTIHFGAKGYSDYTIHKDEKRKENYISRHKVRENWNDLNTAGAWSRFLLWNAPTLNESINDMEKKFDIRILTKLK